MAEKEFNTAIIDWCRSSELRFKRQKARENDVH